MPDFHVARDHDAVDGRMDDGVPEIDLGLVDLALRLPDPRFHRPDIRLGLLERCLRRVEVALRDLIPRSECSRPVELVLRVVTRDLRLVQVGPCLCECRAGLLDFWPRERRIQAREHLAAVDDGIEVGVELRDGAGDLAADEDRLSRL